MVDSASTLLRHRAAQLGMITHLANNYPDLQVNEKGQQVTRYLRDSVERPKRPWNANSVSPLPPPTPTPPKAASNAKPASIEQVKAWVPDTAPSKRARIMQQNKRREQEMQGTIMMALSRQATAIASSPSNESPADASCSIDPQIGSVLLSAPTRFEAMRLRIAAKKGQNA